MKRPSLRAVQSARARLLAKRIGAVLVVVTLIVAGMLFRYPQFGAALLAVYGLFALAARVPYTVTFKMALVILVCVPVLSLRSDDELLDFFAVYAFLLLAIGLAGVLHQEWIPQRTKREKSQE